jgi:hypothetical protein
MWRKALPILQSLGIQLVLLAFDADWRSNPHVAQALRQAAFAMVQAGYEMQVEDWAPALGKGIDDLLVAGHTPVRQSSAFVWRIVQPRSTTATAGLRTMRITQAQGVSV